MSDVRYECVSELATGRDLCARQVSIPSHPFLTDEEVERVIAACNAWN